MTSKAATVEQYLEELPEDRRADIAAIRQVIKKNLPKGFAEGMQYGMIGYFVPHKLYPPGYHCDPKQPLPFAGLAAQKNYLSIYLMGLAMKPDLAEWFKEAYEATGKKLDKGKCCVRAKRLSDVALDVLGEAVGKISAADFIAHYESVIPESKRKKK
jgi:hypothetical protein